MKEEKEQSEPQSQLQIGKVVYLTFDDGPHSSSEKLLQILKKYDAKATFFMLEPNMNMHANAVKLMVEEGHTVGVHGVSHTVAKIYKSPASFIAEMQQAINRVEELTNVHTRLIRAPYGSKPYVTAPFRTAIDQEHLLMWDWNIDSTDWKLTNGSYVQNVIEQIEQLVNKQPLVILLHEKQSTIDHIEKLLIYLQDNGYEMKSIYEDMEPIQFK
nr:polysaccharide deacetylase family protein [Bacillus sp. FJAT-50079]